MSKEETQKFWNDRPCLPEEDVVAFSKRFVREFAFVFKGQDLKGKRVLDLGCGSGKETVVACRTGAHVIAVDYTQAGVDLTSKRLKDLGLSDNEVIKADIENLDFIPDSTIDFVFSLGVFHHTPDTEKAVSEVYRVLKPNGTFVMMVYNKWTRWMIRWLANRPYDKQNWDGGCPIVKFYDRKGLKELLHQFEIDEIRGFGGFYKVRGTVIVKLGLDRWFGWWYVRAVKRSEKEGTS